MIRLVLVTHMLNDSTVNTIICFPYFSQWVPLRISLKKSKYLFPICFILSLNLICSSFLLFHSIGGILLETHSRVLFNISAIRRLRIKCSFWNTEEFFPMNYLLICIHNIRDFLKGKFNFML